MSTPSRSSSDQEHVARGVGADGAGAAHAGPEPSEDERRAAGGPRGGHADLLDERAALPLGDRLHRPDEHVEHVHPEGDDVHGLAQAGRVSP